MLLSKDVGKVSVPMSMRLKQAARSLLDLKSILFGLALFHFLSNYVFWHRIYSHDPPLEICCGMGLAPLLAVLCTFALLFGRVWTNLMALGLGILFVYESSYRWLFNCVSLHDVSVWSTDAVACWWDVLTSDAYYVIYLVFGVVVIAYAFRSILVRVMGPKLKANGDA